MLWRFEACRVCTLARSARLLAVHTVQRCDAPRMLAVHSPGLALLQGPHSGALKWQTTRRSVPAMPAAVLQLPRAASVCTAFPLAQPHMQAHSCIYAVDGATFESKFVQTLLYLVCARTRSTHRCIAASEVRQRGAGQNGAQCAQCAVFSPISHSSLDAIRPAMQCRVQSLAFAMLPNTTVCFVVRIATADCCLLFSSS